MIRISGVYFLLLIVALSLSYFVSTYITKNLKAIASVLSKTDFNAVNENIVLSAESAEIQILIDSYNKMLEALKSSAERLAKSEREQAWREMAKQVAHEIKNPLTPMRLQIQEFEHNYKQTEKIDPKELKEFAQICSRKAYGTAIAGNFLAHFAIRINLSMKSTNLKRYTR